MLASTPKVNLDPTMHMMNNLKMKDNRYRFNLIKSRRYLVSLMAMVFASQLFSTAVAAPVNDFVLADVDETALINVLVNDTGGPANTDVCIEDQGTPLTCDADGIVTIAGEGTYTLIGTSIQFVPEAGFSGLTTPINYLVNGGTEAGRIDVVINERSLCDAGGAIEPYIMGNPAGTDRLVVFQVDDGTASNQTTTAQVEIDHDVQAAIDGVSRVNQINSFGLDTARNYAFYVDNSQGDRATASPGANGNNVLFMLDATTQTLYEIIGPNSGTAFNDFGDIGVSTCNSGGGGGFGTELGGAAGEYFGGSYYFGIEEDQGCGGGVDADGDGRTFDQVYRIDLDYSVFPPVPIPPAILVWEFDPVNAGGVGSGLSHDWGDILIMPDDPDGIPGTGDERLILLDFDRNQGAGNTDFIHRIDITDPTNATLVEVNAGGNDEIGQGAIAFDNTVYVFLASGDEIATYDVQGAAFDGDGIGQVSADIEIIGSAATWPEGAQSVDGSSCVDPTGELPVTMSYFQSRELSSKLEVRWQTSTETFTAGFNIWGQVNNEWVQLNKAIVRTRVLDSVVPRNYRVKLVVGDLDGPLTRLAMTSVDVNGHEEGFGPFELGERYGTETSFEPIPWDTIRAEYNDRMTERDYVLVNHRWRKMNARLEARLASKAASAEVLAHIGTDKDGMVRITYAELLSAGIDLSTVKKSHVALTYKGQPVPRRVGGPGRQFGPGSYLDFYGEAPKGSDALYIPENVYQLGKDSTKALPVKRIKRRPGDSPGTYLATSRVEEDNQYSNILPSGDPFLMAILFAFGGNDATFPALTQPGYPVEVSADIDTTQESRIEVHLGAISNPPGQDLDGDGATDPDHSVEILINGHAAVLDNPTMDGFGDWLVTGTLAPGILQPGSNELRIHMLPTGYIQTDLVALDGYGVHYPRPLNVVLDKLEIGEINSAANEGAEGYTVNGLSQRRAHVYAFNPSSDDRPGNLVRLKSRSRKLGGGLYSASFPTVGDSGARYWVSTAAEFGQASITPSAASSNLLSRQGDYLLIGHGSFLPLSGQTESGDHKLNEYIAAKELEGYTPVVVDIADIVEDFGFGMKTPDALTRYLKAADAAFAYEHALLIGGNVNDYLNKVGDPANPPISYIPTKYAVTSERLVYTPTDALIVDFDGDELSDKALGRWPVRTEAELGYIVDKTLAFGSASSGVYQDRTALLIAEEVTPQEGFNFKQQMERINKKLESLNPSDAANPIKWDATAGAVDRIYVDDIIAEDPPGGYLAAAQVRIQDGINQPDGQALTIFGGHGAPMSWSFNNLMTPAIAQNNLTNAGTPTLMMPMACYTTFYSETSTNTLAHQLLLAGDQGAVAIHAAATLSRYLDNERMGTATLQNQLIGGQTLGQAIEQARQSVNVRNVQINWTLLGDPTLRLE